MNNQPTLSPADQLAAAREQARLVRANALHLVADHGLDRETVGRLTLAELEAEHTRKHTEHAVRHAKPQPPSTDVEAALAQVGRYGGREVSRGERLAAVRFPSLVAAATWVTHTAQARRSVVRTDTSGELAFGVPVVLHVELH